MDAKRPVALVTGASSGIGRAISRRMASAGYDLILVARREDKLQTLAEELRNYGRQAQVIAMDCARSGAAERLVERIRALEIDVDVLVNNAGFAQRGLFCKNDALMDFEVVQLNAAFLTELTRLVLPQMLQRNSGKLLNVASTAAFLPGPGMAVYYATKAYVLSFSEALWSELQGTGVRVSVLCPGPTESEFGSRSGMEKTVLFKRTMSAEAVAAAAYRGLKRNKRIIIPGMLNRLIVCGARITPSRLLLKIVRLLHDV